ncbi:uncharacterized protein isoform X2 [Rhodnius prolixus]|uniref:uncharacterized protein isoform X2 n=1 Tax=Rhodnius prolixus TaxID=13249 RepID=UPI003D187784
MDPVGSWSAYAASFNRLTNSSGIQNGPSSDHLLGSNNCGQGVPSSTSQLFLQAHTGSTMPTASPFTPAGFLSPSPVAYDSMFTPIFHQKAHYGSLQHRSSLKQASESDYTQLPQVCGNFFEQPTGWSQGNPQLPSPFGILPHESVVPNASSKPYDNVNPHVQLQSLGHQNSQLNAAFIDPKKQTHLSAPPKPSAFFQQPVISDSGYKNSEYSPRFSYGHIQQPCALQATGPPKEFRISQSSRILFEQNFDRGDYGFLLPKVTNSQRKPSKYESSERGLDSESQSSPISYAMIDTERGYENSKARPQQFQVNEEQSCRFNSDADYLRKSNENYSASDGSDYVGGVHRRSPSGQPASPVYPLYSPMTSISSPSPSQPEVCYNKSSNDEDPPLDVSLTQNSVSFSSVTRSEKSFTDDRFDRDDIAKQQWDERQRRYLSYEAPNTQRCYEDPNQSCLQDLSSCRGDPMSLVKTLQQQIPDRYSDDRIKRTRMNQEKVQEPTCNREPPPAHHNANLQNQSGYFEFDRWNIASGQHQHQSTTALVVPPLSYLPAFHVSTSQPNSQPNPDNGDNEEQPVPSQQPPSACKTPSATPPADATPPSPKQNSPQPSIVVPDIEEELSFLTDGNLTNENESSIKKKLAPNPNAEYHVTYLNFLKGNQQTSSPLNSAPVKKPMWAKEKPIRTKEVTEELVLKNSPPRDYPSDPRDDPRYYPLPTSTYKRSFESSDSEEEQAVKNEDVIPNISGNTVDSMPTIEADSGSKNISDDVTCAEENELLSKQETVAKGTENHKNNKKSKSQPKATEALTDSDSKSKAGETSDSNNKRNRRKTKVPEMDHFKIKTEEVDLDNLSSDSNLDPAWEPNSEDEEKIRSRSGRRKRKFGTHSSSSDEDEDDEYLPSTHKRRKSKRKMSHSKPKVVTTKPQPPPPAQPQPQPRPPPPKEGKVRVVSQEKLLSPTVLSNNVNQTKKTLNPSFPFSVYDFVIATVDQKSYFPPIWRVKEHNMLHKFLHFVKNGVSYYTNVPTFTAWSPGSKFVYAGVDVKLVKQIKRDITVKLLSRNLLDVTVGRDIIDRTIKDNMKYQDNFDIFIQTLISHSLDSNFLKAIVLEKDDYFLNNVKVIDDYIDKLKRYLTPLLRWSDQLLEAVEKYPGYRTKLNSGSCVCNANAEVSLGLNGTPYDYQTLENLQEVVDVETVALEVSFCTPCFEYFQVMHKLCHYKKHIFGLCDEQIKVKRREDETRDSSTLLNVLLSDNDWLNKVFMDSCTFWGYVEKIIAIDLVKTKRS